MSRAMTVLVAIIAVLLLGDVIVATKLVADRTFLAQPAAEQQGENSQEGEDSQQGDRSEHQDKSDQGEGAQGSHKSPKPQQQKDSENEGPDD
jgi:hypothetical protein